MDYKNIIKPLAKLFAVYGVQIWIMLFVSNIAFITYIRTRAANTSCMTQTQIDADSRCLYVLSGSIYEKDTRARPHKNHPCGMDVTSIIPAFHNNNASKYLLPNFVAPLCGNNPTPPPTQPPTAPPTAKPTAVPTAKPTNPPTAKPTASPSPRPTAVPTPVPTLAPGATKSPTPKPTAVPTNPPTAAPTVKPTAVPTLAPGATKSPSPKPTAKPTASPLALNLTPIPTQSTNSLETPQPTSKLFAIMAALQNPTPTPESDFINISSNEDLATPVAAPQTTPVNKNEYNLIYWSTILSYASFVILLITGVYWLVQKIKLRIKTMNELKNISTPTSTNP